jgi:thiol-disulfide isomerase/thioredoxin
MIRLLPKRMKMIADRSLKLLTVLALVLFLVVSCGPRGESDVPLSVLTEREKSFVRENLANMKNEVELISFTGSECPTCNKAEVIYDEIADQAGKVMRQRFRLDSSPAEAEEYGVSRVPAAVLKKGDRANIKFFGLPGGYEFEPFVEGIRSLSEGKPKLSPATVAGLSGLSVPVNIKIFVTPG